MFNEQQIARLRLRIRRAAFETEAWRASGPPEKYLESFCNIESLEQQLDQLIRESAMTPTMDGAAPVAR